MPSFACRFFFFFENEGLPVPPNSHQLSDCLLSLPARLALVTHVWACPCVILQEGSLEISIIPVSSESTLQRPDCPGVLWSHRR